MCTCSRETEFLAYLLTSSAYASSLLSSSILPRMVLIFCGQSSGRSLGVALCCSAPSRAFMSRGIGNLVFKQLMGNVSSLSLVCRLTHPEILWIRRVSTPKYCFSFGHSTITSSSIPQSSPFFSAWLSGVLSRSGRYISVGADVSSSPVSSSWCSYSGFWHCGSLFPASAIFLLFLLLLFLPIFSGSSMKLVKFAPPLLLVLDIRWR